MFINLTARKDNGDFYVTSSEVEMEKWPGCFNDSTIRRRMLELAEDYFIQGWDVELTQKVL